MGGKMKSSFSRDNLILLIGLGSGVLGIILGFWGFVRDISKGQFDWPWLFILIFLVVLVYRIFTKQTGVELSAPSDRTVSIEQALEHVGTSEGQFRVNILQNRFPLLPNNLSGEEAAKLLGSLDGQFRVNAIKILAPKIRSKIGDHELVLESLDGEFRRQASKHLSES
jgi:hypothetical protein